MCTCVIESHMPEHHPNTKEVVYALSAAGSAVVVVHFEPKTKQRGASSARCHNPYLPAAVVLGSASVSWSNSSNNGSSSNNNNSSSNSRSSSSSSSGNTSSPVAESIALPTVHRMRDHERSPFVAKNPCQKQCSGTPGTKAAHDCDKGLSYAKLPRFL